MDFSIAFFNVVLTVIYILPGFILCKSGKLSAKHLPGLSALLVYVCSPCMIISNFASVEFTPSLLLELFLFFVFALFLQASFVALLYFLLVRRGGAERKWRVLSISSVFGNVGFFGLPVIKSLLPDFPEAVCFSSAFVIAMNLLVFTVGVFCLTGDKKYMSLRAGVLNPTFFGMIVALIIFVLSLGPKMPPMLYNSISLVGNMSTPLCMLILGARLATVPLRPLFCRPFVYFSALSKLLLFPLFCFLTVYFLPLPFSFRASAVILSATPSAVIVSNMAEIYGTETELSANCVLLSTLLCVFTVPLVSFLLGA